MQSSNSRIICSQLSASALSLSAMLFKFSSKLNLIQKTFMSSLSGKVAIVTASTDGIGFSIARKLGKEGAKVVISSRKQTNVDKAVDQLSREGISVQGVVCHVAKQEDRHTLLQKTLDNFGKVDILVSNAAVNPAMGQLLDTTEQEFDKIFEVNVKCAFLLTKQVVPHMNSKGSIVYISSIGAYQPFPLISCYSVSKTALLGLSRAVALQLAPDVRANVVCPGIIKTRFSEPLWNNEQAMEEISRLVPMGRIGQSEEVANLVSFLASDQSSYITGESFVVAGGQFSRL